MSKVVRKAVIPVAGLGTRMLPATKAIPKEMLPIVDRPIIQYIVDECVAAGIKEIILVTHASKNAIENHFDTSFELESTLEKRVKRQLLDEIKSIVPSDVTIMHVRQGEALGLGDAVLKAYPLVGDEPFAVVLPDVLIAQNSTGADLAVMLDNFNQWQASQIMVEPVPSHLVERYGIVDCQNAEKQAAANVSSLNWPIYNVVEKPDYQDAPSNLAIVGRYVFSSSIWSLLSDVKPGVGGEIQLTDAIAKLIEQESVSAYQLQGKSHDCGSKLGYLTACVEYALGHSELGLPFQAALEVMLNQKHLPETA
ncbi:UTP--glucose-1-phosphate uridylyltransferase GalU [Psychrobium sp. MM17-31]|uniref:UTP--glucose-1-phosphate uridylyltransferase GalU n=1 Tax=Psychrobium sp. MM17-31 TaxID=2917758 RepID=UPI001EF7334A|nr:UTP--glucose-1-phosphate uridylyltransferase GalU [Psychrobium sp. MM17-31]MCG7533347.1 UTP--glucose-1-phosphate uridylyltransferase GalU [Psychrobium sp. MM17-31]